MSAFYIVFVEKPAEPTEIAEYRRLAMPTLKDKEVKFHSRPGCEIHTVEGDEVDVVVVLEFKSVQAAKGLVPFARIPKCRETSPPHGAQPCRDRREIAEFLRFRPTAMIDRS